MLKNKRNKVFNKNSSKNMNRKTINYNKKSISEKDIA